MSDKRSTKQVSDLDNIDGVGPKSPVKRKMKRSESEKKRVMEKKLLAYY